VTGFRVGGGGRARLVFRALLLIYPRAFRVKHADAMMSTFLDSWRHRRRGLRPRGSFWLRTLADGVTEGLAERRTSRRSGHRERFRGRSGSRSIETMGCGAFGPGDLTGDIRLSLRGLRRSPGFAVLVIGTLALGIGANVAILSLADAALLHPLPVEQPERLIRVYEAVNARAATRNFGETWGSGGDDVVPGPVAYATLRSLDPAKAGLSGIAAYWPNVAVEIAGAGGAAIGRADLVSGDYFRVLGVRAALGRVLVPADEEGWGSRAVAVLSHEFWHRRFRGDSSVVGRTIRLSGSPFVVVGVAAPEFRGLSLGSSTDMWVPLTVAGAVAGRTNALFSSPDFLTNPDDRVLSVIARLAPGVTRPGALARLNAARLTLPYETEEGVEQPVLVNSLLDSVVPARADLVRFLGMLAGVVGLTLLAACVNVANLLLVRARRNYRDLAVRAALGARRLRLFRQLLVEALVLGGLGGLAALLVARSTIGLLSSFSLPGQVAVSRLGAGSGGKAFVLTGASALLAVLLFGTLPAWWASRASALSSLRSRAGDRPSRSGRGALLAVQTGLSVVLLTGAALFLRTLQEAVHTDAGFRPDSAAAVSVRIRAHGVDSDQATLLVNRLLDATRSQPGVTRAALALHVPIASGAQRLPFVAAGGADNPVTASVNVVTPEYFGILGIPLRRGRLFTDGDRETGAPVIVVNEAAAALLWPERDALGGRAGISFGRNRAIVVGVVGQTLVDDLTSRDQPCVYYPFAQWPVLALASASLMARGPGGEAAALAGLDAAVRGTDPDLPVFDRRSVRAQIDTVLAPQRFGATLLGFFSVLSLAIAGVGIYGVAAQTVVGRRQEVGIRVALGAGAGHVVREVLGGTAVAAAGGAVAGLLCAAALAGLVRAFLFGITPLDPRAFTWAFTALAAVVLLASVVPAMRAIAVNPVESMRGE